MQLQHKLYDVDEILNKEQIKNYPIINTDDVTDSIFNAHDGAADPSEVTHMLAKAKNEGAKIYEKFVLKNHNKEWHLKVKVDDRIIDCEYIVLASGMWSRQIGEKIRT